MTHFWTLFGVPKMTHFWVHTHIWVPFFGSLLPTTAPGLVQKGTPKRTPKRVILDPFLDPFLTPPPQVVSYNIQYLGIR